MAILFLNIPGFAMVHFSRMCSLYANIVIHCHWKSFTSSSLNEQVSLTDNSSIYRFNVTRMDNRIKYECQISNQALSKALRVEKYLHVQCKRKMNEREKRRKKQRNEISFLLDRPSVKILAKTSISSSTEDKIIAIENTEQRLTCQIDANPPATSIYWTMNSTTVVSRK